MALMALTGLAALTAAPAGAATALTATLRARYTALQPQLAHNAYQRPLYLESTQTSGDLKGEVYAVVEHPFAQVRDSLQQADAWCGVLILHLNVKACHTRGAAGSRHIDVSIGKKVQQSATDAYQVSFDYRAAGTDADELQLQLAADDGPLGTRNYRIALEAVPLDAQRSFVHMSYAYGYGMAARLAMQGYLATLGRGKVGFSVIGSDARGQPKYVGNVRGVVERNTMRYYLAIEAYLDALDLPEPQRFEKRLRDWFAATERYPLQLHEIELAEYLAMKRVEARQ